MKKKIRSKKILSILFTCVMMFSVIPTIVFAANNTAVTKGKTLVEINKTPDSQVYVGYVEINGNKEYYIYSDNIIHNSELFQKLKQSLNTAAGSEYANLVPDIMNTVGTVGLKASTVHEDKMNENWKSATWVAENVMSSNPSNIENVSVSYTFDSEIPSGELVGEPFVSYANQLNAKNELYVTTGLSIQNGGFAVVNGELTQIQNIVKTVHRTQVIFVGAKDNTSTTSNTYVVTFNNNGHGIAPATQTIERGNKVSEPTALTATGWTFAGWYKDSALTTPYDFNTAITSDIILYAKWIENSIISVTNIAVAIAEPVLGATPDYNPTFTTTPGGETLYNTYVEWYKLAEADYTDGVNDDWGLPMEHTETFTSGYYYAPTLRFIPKTGYALATTITATINGQPHDLGYGSVYQQVTYSSNPYAYVTYDFEPLIVAPAIAIIEGNGQEWTKGTATDIEFKSTANFTDFVSVEIDNAKIDASNYIVKEGSTIITLRNSYLETLSVGEHSIVIVSTTGRPSAKFTVKDINVIGGNKVNNNSEITNNDRDNSNINNSQTVETKTEEPKSEVKEEKAISNPQTGDNIVLFAIIAIIALVGIIFTIKLKNKKNKKNNY